MTSNLFSFYKGKRVLVTGHTGFKGTWMSRILVNAGAIVTGYSLKAPTDPNLFDLADIKDSMTSVIGDIRDLNHFKEVVKESKPEIIFHLAAQPIVRDSYKNPVYTYETNVMGTVNVMEAIRLAMPGMELNDGSWSPKSVVIITTDKVYKNNEWAWGYRENEPLDGFDPYSNSKSCAELAVHSYRDSFFRTENGYSLPISTTRAGNVIGGGDFANDRIIPDSVRAMEEAYNNNVDTGIIGVRNPYSTRPYQHVLEPLAMYLTLAMEQYEDGKIADYYNVGPDDCDCVTTGDLINLFCEKWNESGSKVKATWENRAETNAPHEANFLKLDSTKIKNALGYKPRWHIDECMEKTVQFSRVYLENPDGIPDEMDNEIQNFFML